ncbi:MAG: NUDIX domain-containing protein [Woeseiaceae bacterium]
MSEPERLSCGFVLVRNTARGPLTLMLRAWHHWDFPKGLREDGEQAIEAAVREVGEETGICDLTMKWGERHLDSGPYSRGKTARYFLASTETEKVEMGLSLETGEPEHHEWRWVSFDEAYDLSSPRVKNVVKWARQIIGS